MSGDTPIPFTVGHAEAIVRTEEKINGVDAKLSLLASIGIAVGVSTTGFLGAILAVLIMR